MSGVTFSGLASGIDSTSIIASLVSQRRKAQIDPLQRKINELGETNTSLGKLQELLGTLKGSADTFRDLSGSVLAKLTASSNESRVSATATNAASNGTYAIDILSLAKNGNASFDDRFASAGAFINSSINDGASAASRTVSVEVGTGTDQEIVAIELTSSTSISDFVSQFNASSQKAQASLVNVGTSSTPSYAVVINSISQGTALGQLAISAGSEITSAGSGAFGATTISQATNAQFTVDGVSGLFTRATNAVTDVIAGVTFNLQSTGTSTVTISNDAATTAQSVQSFVDAYNEVINYVSKNDLVSKDEATQEAIFGPLAGTSIDENLIGALRSAFSSSSTSGNTVNSLADLGLTTERDGTIKFDSDLFQNVVGTDPEAVRSITRNLGETLAGVDGTIAQYSRFNGLIDVAERGNQIQIDSYTTRIADLEKLLGQQEEQLTAQFARLESAIGKLNSQQAALSGLAT